MKEFVDELKDVINKHGIDNNMNIPDFILAQYLSDCLESLKLTLRNIEGVEEKNWSTAVPEGEENV